MIVYVASHIAGMVGVALRVLLGINTRLGRFAKCASAAQMRRDRGAGLATVFSMLAPMFASHWETEKARWPRQNGQVSVLALVGKASLADFLKGSPFPASMRISY